MQFRLNRFFYIFEKSFVIVFLIWMLLSVWIAFNGFSQFAAAITVSLLMIFWRIFISPKYIYISSKEIKYTRHEIVDKGEIFSRRRPQRTTKVRYYVSDIDDFNVEQNRFERIFNVARITFSGATEYDTKERYMDRIIPRGIHTVRGVVLTKKFVDHIESIDSKWAERILDLRRDRYRKRK